MTRRYASSAPGLIVAAPASGHGKTIVTLGLLRHFRDSGVPIASFKVGPDYIDPAFHAAASGRPCRNLDLWAMRDGVLRTLAARISSEAELVIGEGVMGLFDGPGEGKGSTADLAAATGWPVVLVIDVRAQAASAAALVHGFADFRTDVRIAGVIFNRIASAAHARMIERACEGLAPRLLGFLPTVDDIELPERHLGLVQAQEHPALEAAIARAARLVGEHLDTAAIHALARPAGLAVTGTDAAWRPLGQRIALAHDVAFTFAYPHLIEGWREAGAEILPFSPLADEPPAPSADAVFLPGGYPEMHAGRLAAARRFLDGLHAAAARGAFVYGECGGYMVLGRGLVDADGRRHAMADLLPLETSFAEARLHLGYRRAELLADCPLGPRGTVLRGHEFHYARIVREDHRRALFVARDAAGVDLGRCGMRLGSVAGSFLHVIDRG